MILTLSPGKTDRLRNFSTKMISEKTSPKKKFWRPCVFVVDYLWNYPTTKSSQKQIPHLYVDVPLSSFLMFHNKGSLKHTKNSYYLNTWKENIERRRWVVKIKYYFVKVDHFFCLYLNRRKGRNHWSISVYFSLFRFLYLNKRKIESLMCIRIFVSSIGIWSNVGVNYNC